MKTHKLLFILLFISFISCESEIEDVTNTQIEISNEQKLLNYLLNELEFESSMIEDKGDAFLVDGVIEFPKKDFETTNKLDVTHSSKSTFKTIHRHRVSRRSSNHFYRTTRVSGFPYEGITGRVLNSGASGTVPLYYFENVFTKDGLFTRNRAEVPNLNAPWSGNPNRPFGYIYTRSASGRQPLYRYYSSRINDHFYTQNYSELGSGRDGYIFEGILGYTLR